MDFQNLHAVVMVRDIVRKWWGAELSYADRHGVVPAWAQGAIVPPPNDYCRLSLFSPEGFRRCGASVSVLHDKFVASKKLRRCQVHDCHLGFTIVGAPIYVGGEFDGMLFVEGFLRQPSTAKELQHRQAKIAELNPGATDLERANERVPSFAAPDFDRLCDLLELGAAEIANSEAEVSKRSQTTVTPVFRLEEIVGNSAPMVEVFSILNKVSATDATVLINGESGTGKELVARAIHAHGPRKTQAFVVQNCSAFNDNLLESALFGHVRGAFTGATRDQKGLFEVADRGTFFLDEIGDMSPALQVKLLRVLQEGVFTPVGSTQPKRADVRVIAATHKDLGAMVQQGTFREDLYYRINVVRLEVPPLRRRPGDLPLLIEHFLRKHRRAGQRTRGLRDDALDVLRAYVWPGNIRELENEIERLLVLGGDVELIPASLLSSRITDAVNGTGPSSLERATVEGQGLNEAVEQLERQLIAQGLRRTKGNKSRLSRELGISRSNLLLKIQKYGLEPSAAAEVS